jgi:hypothetical protein
MFGAGAGFIISSSYSFSSLSLAGSSLRAGLSSSTLPA